MGSALEGYSVLVWYLSGKYDQGWKDPLQSSPGLHFSTLHFWKLSEFPWSDLMFFATIISQIISKFHHICSPCMLLCSFLAFIINKLHICLMCILPAGMQTPSEQKLCLPFELLHPHCLSLCYVYAIASACKFLIFYPLSVYGVLPYVSGFCLNLPSLWRILELPLSPICSWV